jgi:uncharacterized protein YehS (DUF1456 family)
MTNNDILRRIRFIFDFGDSKMISIFGLADHSVTREQISNWLKKDDDPSYEVCSDKQLATFLNGLIVKERGKKDGDQPLVEEKINNNIIFMKLKIALNMKAEEILAVIGLAGLHIGKHELSAFFRKKGHKHYRECKDQVLRNFLQGLQLKHHDKLEPAPVFQWKKIEDK